jgi:hypothetical protein
MSVNSPVAVDDLRAKGERPPQPAQPRTAARQRLCGLPERRKAVRNPLCPQHCLPVGFGGVLIGPNRARWATTFSRSKARASSTTKRAAPPSGSPIGNPCCQLEHVKRSVHRGAEPLRPLREMPPGRTLSAGRRPGPAEGLRSPLAGLCSQPAAQGRGVAQPYRAAASASTSCSGPKAHRSRPGRWPAGCRAGRWPRWDSQRPLPPAPCWAARQRCRRCRGQKVPRRCRLHEAAWPRRPSSAAPEKRDTIGDPATVGQLNECRLFRATAADQTEELGEAAVGLSAGARIR